MQFHRITLVVVVSLSLIPVAIAARNSRSHFALPVSSWHLSTAPHTQFVTLRQVGSPYSTKDDTRTVTLVDGLGQRETTQSARWKLVKLPVSIPRRAKAVKLSIRAAITRGRNDGDTVVYAFARTPGARCCPGPPGFEAYPVDFSLAGKKLDGSDNARPPMVVQADAVGRSASYRGWETFDLPIQRGRFEFAWGYRKTAGTWPEGDAVGLSVYVDGWAD